MPGLKRWTAPGTCAVVRLWRALVRFLVRGSARVTDYFLINFANLFMDSNTFLSQESTHGRSRGSHGDRAPSSSSSSVGRFLRRGKRRRGGGRDKKRRAGARKRQLKSERKAKTHLRVLFWNCGSLKIRKRTAEVLANNADIVCLQKTQHATMKPTDYQIWSLMTKDMGRSLW